MAMHPDKVSPEIKQQIIELVTLYLQSGEQEIEEFVELFNSKTKQPLNEYALISVRTVDARPTIKQMIRPSLSNVTICSCCGRPK
ncbi:MAG: hypothetical protein Phog2KO_07710 [Phototrophicaceae bacterium]